MLLFAIKTKHYDTIQFAGNYPPPYTAYRVVLYYNVKRSNNDFPHPHPLNIRCNMLRFRLELQQILAFCIGFEASVTDCTQSGCTQGRPRIGAQRTARPVPRVAAEHHLHRPGR